MSYLELKDTKLYYETKNLNSCEKVFVFLHGLGGSIEQTKNAFVKIPESLGVVYVDLRANGKSPYSKDNKISFDIYAKDVKKLCDHLKLSKISIGGISMGAATSTKFALKYPKMVEKLVLIRIAWLDRPMAKKIRDENMLISYYIDCYGKEDGKIKYLKDKKHINNERKYPKNEESNVKAFDYKYAEETCYKYRTMPLDHPIDSMAELESINQPTMILANHFDPPHPYNYGIEYHRHIKNSVFHEITSKNVDLSKHSKQLNDYLYDFLID